ncbi:uncharacterized protein LOC110882263 [Helianthus annuus]|uniref:uncharacterized protein LOC110882263 n=1 Tax=Helianthus annuus TaxID=4232 RepID=UPI000B900CAB|nr:uncharacterized protein LOC110882263 [Helianthus annuus]
MSKRSKEKESADRAKKHPVSRSLPDLDSKDRISTLEREMARIKKKEVNAVQFEVCEDCGDIGHRAEQCPTGLSDYTEEVNQVGRVIDNGVKSPSPQFVEEVVEDASEDEHDDGQTGQNKNDLKKKNSTPAMTNPVPKAKKKGSQVEVERSIDEEVKSLEVLAVREAKPTWTHQVKSLQESIDTKLKPSLVEPPEVELKALPKHLKYAYVGEGNTLQVIIASNLTVEQEEKLMEVLVTNQVPHGEEGCKTEINPMGVVAPRVRFGDTGKKGIENVVADHLSRLTVEEDPKSLEINESFPDEHIMKLDKLPWYANIVNYLVTGRERKLKLCELEELREMTYECASKYKDGMKKAHDGYNSKLKFFPGKLRSKWMGPYVITRVGQLGDVTIEDPKDGVRQTVNGHRLKPFLDGNEKLEENKESVSFVVSIPVYEVE